MHSAWFRSSFLKVFKFQKIKEGGPNFLGEPILKNRWIIWSSLLYFNLKKFKDWNYLSFIRFQCVLYDSEELLQNGWIIWSSLLYFNFKTFKDPNSSSFIRFQCVLYDSEGLFSHLWNFCKLKRGDLISGGTNSGDSLN